MIEFGRRYLVTGGTGFLGEKLIQRIIGQGGIVRTIARNEGKLIALKEKFGNDIEIHFGDIANRFTVEQFMECPFRGVFHLAAFKHVPLAETFSMECTNSNVIGSLHVLDVATNHNPDFILGISTDKAAQVAGVYGASKLLMEKAFEQYSHTYPGIQYRIVRYGNVLYSTGSVLCKWKNILENNEHVILTVSNREATRFFWTLDQALDLVYDCLDNATDSKPYVPEMKAISIDTLVKAMIEKYGKKCVSVSITETGLQKGENLHEKVLEQGPYSNEVELFTMEEVKAMI